MQKQCSCFSFAIYNRNVAIRVIFRKKKGGGGGHQVWETGESSRGYDHRQ